MALEQIGYKGPEGSIQYGIHRQVISGLAGGTTARQLLASEAGALCLFDNAAGQIYTLPAPVVGMEFHFLVTVDVTSNAYSLDTDAATTFLMGGIIMGDVTVATSGDYFEADGTSTVSCDAEGSTTGGLLGGEYRVICISSTQWGISGVMHGAGTLATPFA